jgi:hypothetical protein
MAEDTRLLLRLAGVCLAVSAVTWQSAVAQSTPKFIPTPTSMPTSTAPPAPATSLPYTITIQSGEGLQIAQKEHKEWYQEGIWPLIGPVVAILIANTVAITIVYLQSTRSFNALLRQRKIELLSLSLNDFYNPLLALLEINGEIFAKTGPRAFPDEHHEREAAALIWKEMKKKLLENNREIELIQRTKTHLIYKSDTLDAYKALLIHVAMYETFQTIETDRYAGFQFPQEVKAHIIGKRSLLLGELYALSGEQI